MQIGALVYVHYKKSILLVNWKKYGYWCCIGGNIGENGNTLHEVALNCAYDLCGVNPSIKTLRGVVTFSGITYEKEPARYYIFDAETDNPDIKLSPLLNNAKWAAIDKVLNYKLFPNSERYVLNTYLNSNEFFDLDLVYSESGAKRTLNYLL